MFKFNVSFAEDGSSVKNNSRSSLRKLIPHQIFFSGQSLNSLQGVTAGASTGLGSVADQATQVSGRLRDKIELEGSVTRYNRKTVDKVWSTIDSD
jgi:hypothetical protein